MFKSRSVKKRNIRISAESDPIEDGNEIITAPTAAEARALMNMRKRKIGIDINNIPDPVDPQEEIPQEPSASRSKRPFQLDQEKRITEKSFERYENALDATIHMEKYIQDQLNKKREKEKTNNLLETTSKTSVIPTLSTKTESFDVVQNVWQAISDKLKPERKVQDETNIDLSMSNLMAVPEVDLGVSSKLKNIEATERAKKRIIENPNSNVKFIQNDFTAKNIDTKNDLSGIAKAQDSSRFVKRYHKETDFD